MRPVRKSPETPIPIANTRASACRGTISPESDPTRTLAEKIRALVDNIRGKKDRDIDGEVVKKDDDDG